MKRPAHKSWPVLEVRVSFKYNIPRVTEEGVSEDCYKVKTLHHTTYLTKESQEDPAYMEGFKEAMADRLVSAFAEFLYDNPEVIEMDKNYEASRNATRFDATIRVLRREE